MTKPQDHIADCLVLTFTEGVSLLDWEKTGLLEREWALYEHLRPLYRRMVLATWGGEKDRAFAERLGAEVVCAAGQQDLAAQTAESVLRIDAPHVVVKTNQMMGGETAVETAALLRAGGRQVGLIARGGYPWSRFVAWECGFASRAAAAAAQREAKLCRAADLIVGTTRSMVEELCWRYGIDSARARVIPNYVDVRKEPRSETPHGPPMGGTTADEVEILFAGRLVEQKRIDRLIAAVGQLPSALRQRVRVRIIGAGPLEASLRVGAAEAGIHAEFQERVSHGELLGIMSRPGIYCQTSDYEGNPKTVLEALACGRAVVVTDAPGMRDVVKDARTGLVVSPEPRAIAEALALLIKDPPLALALGAAGAAEVRAWNCLARAVELEIEAHRAALALGSAAAPPVDAPA